MQNIKTGDVRISNAILYVREAHPGAGVPQHRSFEDKRSCAERLKVEDGETRTVFVDDLDGTAHIAYGSLPNTVFIINRNGCVVFRAEWNNPKATQAALNALLNGTPLLAHRYFRPGRPLVSFHTLRRAGKGSGPDPGAQIVNKSWRELKTREGGMKNVLAKTSNIAGNYIQSI